MTRRALARAFGMDDGFFNLPGGDPAEAQAKAEAAAAEFERTWVSLDVNPATGREIVRTMVNCGRGRALMSGQIGRAPRDVEDIMAEVSDYLEDVLWVADMLRNVEVLEYGDYLESRNEELRKHGWHLVQGWREDGTQSTARVQYVFASLIDVDQRSILVERNPRTSL